VNSFARLNVSKSGFIMFVMIP